MTDLENCELCEWRCGVNRLAGERGVCRVGGPEVAATSLSGTLKSYSVTLLGCCYRCLHCNAYRISQYPDPLWWYGRHISPEELVSDAETRIRAYSGSAYNEPSYRGSACNVSGKEFEKEFEIDKISFTGGDPIIHLPYIEEVAGVLRKRDSKLGVGLATGGFCTPESMERIAGICSSITLEIKAFDDEVHRALTGAPVGPVLRNASYLAENAREKIRVFRTVAIPGMTDKQVVKIAEYIAALDPEIPYRLIGFRPNFVLYYHPGPEKEMMEKLAEKCRDAGLKDVAWSGYYPEAYPEGIEKKAEILEKRYSGNREAGLTAAYALETGCPTHPRNCGECELRDRCPATLREPWNRR
ncbi:radical SAM protein [Methanosarcina sp. Mfa9]|uniref:radical SAM protein n=1 Tax=Methanosarcina sp. Mfa9 TaxID=3439063 RepID=UPI003F83986B